MFKDKCFVRFYILKGTIKLRRRLYSMQEENEKGM